MATTLQAVIDGVRELHPAFDWRLLPNQSLARFFKRYQRRLVYEVVRINPDVLLVETNVPYTAALLMGAAGYAIPAHLVVRGGTVHFTADLQRLGELTLLKFQDHLSPVGLYPAFIRGTTLFLVGLAEDWNGVASIDLAYIPLPTDLTALADTFSVPDGAFDALVAAGGLFAATRAAARPELQIDLPSFQVEAERCEKGFLGGVGLQQSSNVHFTKEAW